jgi:demethylmenaquinone methyltransferase/2-methoxy-6-polyprenyl-1,4-benzoquinol methylase/ArsR family transcriptional regulator
MVVNAHRNGRLSFKRSLAALEALGEPTRLRLAALLNEAELTVTELTTILGQSQPRVSRHLKLLVDAGIVERHREGAWAFFRLQDGDPARFVRDALAALDATDATLVADRTRLSEVRSERARMADGYFARHAGDWDQLRALHVAETEVEAALLKVIGPGPFRAVLDLGTGTGRMLSLLAGRAERAVGVDSSAAMLAVARSNIERAGLKNAQLRHGDIYALPVERDGYDVIVIHQVLHYLDDPARAIREACRALRPGGRLLVVDFAPHDVEFLRTDHAHRRLGFTAQEICDALTDAGLIDASSSNVGADRSTKLTVTIWQARDARMLDDTNRIPQPSMKEVA